ncbi:PEP-CTERM sorting domain-containing protein [Acaryochloris sp. IP29b_bin.148]|uniref:PEP-CTERM sorting domain-containing protein n=1 Tax=Acaryochloris sp. IP29b_bin.148 TaxID=2969218 RepID=UPI002607624A|nr:PEP-CTERM sorting domain-containing protein [Acaryochloris sp. IP29b_bin.148]
MKLKQIIAICVSGICLGAQIPAQAVTLNGILASQSVENEIEAITGDEIGENSSSSTPEELEADKENKAEKSANNSLSPKRSQQAQSDPLQDSLSLADSDQDSVAITLEEENSRAKKDLNRDAAASTTLAALPENVVADNAQQVPEPITLLGTALALGFGWTFKKRSCASHQK